MSDQTAQVLPIAKGPTTCSFCGATKDKTRYIIQAPSACICERCVGDCVDIIHEEESKKVRLGEDA